MITASQWKRAVSSVLADVGWAHRGKLSYRQPHEWVLTGVFAEGTRLPDQVRIWAVVMPMFVPVDQLILTFSERVPNGSQTVGLGDLASLEDVIRQAASQLPTENEALEAVTRTPAEEGAYAALILGRDADACEQLRAPFHPDDQRAFVEAARERRREVLEAVEAAGASGGIELLRAWRNGTAAALRVP